MESNLILDHTKIGRILERLAHQIMEETHTETEIVLAGVYPNGTVMAKRLKTLIEKRISVQVSLTEIKMDKSNPSLSGIQISPAETSLSNKTVILADDVMNSGKTTAYALSALLEKGAGIIKTVVLVDRNHKDFPIKADFVGYSLSTNLHDHVQVELGETDSALLV